MSYRLVVSEEAERNRDAELAYYGERSSAYADRWYSAYLATLRALMESPDRFTKAREADFFKSDLREARFGVTPKRPTHRLLFTTRGDEVLIVALRHHAQDDWKG